MIPILFPENATEFASLGLGALAEASSCIVTEEINGAYTLELQYPSNGLRFNDIRERAIVYAKPSPNQDPQPFRIYGSTKPINGSVTFRANHISYDLSNYIAAKYSFSSSGEVFNATNGLVSYAIPSGCPFILSTDILSDNDLLSSSPRTIRSILGEDEGCILAQYGGEWSFDIYECTLHNRRGEDRGFEIRYGRNLSDFSQDYDISEVCTAIYPFWKDNNTNSVTDLNGEIVPVPGTFTYTKVVPVDFSSLFEEPPTKEQLRSAAQAYVQDGSLGLPNDTIDFSFVQLSKSPEYSGYITLLERVDLGDTVKVIFDPYNVTRTARVVSTVYDVLTDRYTTLTIGEVKQNLADTIASQQKTIEERPTVTLTEQISEALIKAMTGTFGGSIRMLDTNKDGYPDTLYIADNPDPNLAQKIWRYNYLGWAASSTGYDGQFVLGATLEDGLLAEFVKAAHLTAGTIESADGGDTFYLDLTNGILRMKASTIAIGDTDLNSVIEETRTTIENLANDQVLLNQYITRDPDTGIITIGDTNNQVRMLLMNNQLTFVTGPAEDPTIVAFFKDSKLQVADIHADNTIGLGNWLVFTDANEGFGIKWMG